MGAFNPQREELVFDGPPPKQGVMGEQDLTKNANAHPLIRWRDVVIESDLYAMPGEPKILHILCPKCRNSLRITEDRKAIDYDPRKMLESGGELNVEPFECTWELTGAEHRMEFGVSLCRWRVGINKNIAVEA